ncbi:MAG: KH domain-containing protein [Candidatus Eiseniibacteriota bacterium]
MRGSGRRQLVDYVARGLVDDPAAVRVTENARSDAQVYELSVAMDDLGKVIGKNGRTAQAMRTLLALSRSDGDEREPILDILD